jgi:nitrogen fixation NifU-like protein
MSDLSDLYQEVILDHSKQPRNFREIPEADSTAEGFNALCGDRVRVYLKMEGDRIADVSFQGSGCAISKASASMMTSALKGKTREEARKVVEGFHDMVTGHPDHGPVDLGKLKAFAGVCEFPARVKCAILAWHTLDRALARKSPADASPAAPPPARED